MSLPRPSSTSMPLSVSRPRLYLFMLRSARKRAVISLRNSPGDLGGGRWALSKSSSSPILRRPASAAWRARAGSKSGFSRPVLVVLAVRRRISSGSSPLMYSRAASISRFVRCWVMVSGLALPRASRVRVRRRSAASMVRCARASAAAICRSVRASRRSSAAARPYWRWVSSAVCRSSNAASVARLAFCSAKCLTTSCGAM